MGNSNSKLGRVSTLTFTQRKVYTNVKYVHNKTFKPSSVKKKLFNLFQSYTLAHE